MTALRGHVAACLATRLSAPRFDSPPAELRVPSSLRLRSARTGDTLVPPTCLWGTWNIRRTSFVISLRSADGLDGQNLDKQTSITENLSFRAWAYDCLPHIIKNGPTLRTVAVPAWPRFSSGSASHPHAPQGTPFPAGRGALPCGSRAMRHVPPFIWSTIPGQCCQLRRSADRSSLGSAAQVSAAATTSPSCCCWMVSTVGDAIVRKQTGMNYSTLTAKERM